MRKCVFIVVWQDYITTWKEILEKPIFGKTVSIWILISIFISYLGHQPVVRSAQSPFLCYSEPIMNDPHRNLFISHNYGRVSRMCGWLFYELFSARSSESYHPAHQEAVNKFDPQSWSSLVQGLFLIPCFTGGRRIIITVNILLIIHLWHTTALKKNGQKTFPLGNRKYRGVCAGEATQTLRLGVEKFVNLYGIRSLYAQWINVLTNATKIKIRKYSLQTATDMFF